jgi:hypothetical protein
MLLHVCSLTFSFSKHLTIVCPTELHFILSTKNQQGRKRMHKTGKIFTTADFNALLAVLSYILSIASRLGAAMIATAWEFYADWYTAI